jgi:hypothetical protein
MGIDIKVADSLRGDQGRTFAHPGAISIYRGVQEYYQMMSRDDHMKHPAKRAERLLLPGMIPSLVSNSPGNGFIHGVKNRFIESYYIPNLSHPWGMGYTH